MVNQQPDGFNEQQWYPQLPEGYERQQSQPMQYQSGWQPSMGHNMQGMPGGWPPGMNQGPGYGSGMHGWPPGQQMPGYGPQPFRPPGQQGQGRPPGFPPGFPSNQQPWNQQGQQNQQGPSSPPPNYTPEYPDAQLFRVDPGGIRGCLYRYTFIWLSRRQGFWFYPTFVGRTSVAGYRWRSGRRRWEYFGIDLNNIDSFTCF